MSDDIERTIRDRITTVLAVVIGGAPMDNLTPDIQRLVKHWQSHARPGGTIGLDGDTKRDWETDGPAIEARINELLEYVQRQHQEYAHIAAHAKDPAKKLAAECRELGYFDVIKAAIQPRAIAPAPRKELKCANCKQPFDECTCHLATPAALGEKGEGSDTPSGGQQVYHLSNAIALAKSAIGNCVDEIPYIQIHNKLWDLVRMLYRILDAVAQNAASTEGGEKEKGELRSALERLDAMIENTGSTNRKDLKLIRAALSAQPAPAPQPVCRCGHAKDSHHRATKWSNLACNDCNCAAWWPAQPAPAPATSAAPDPKCICRGNWRLIISEVESLFGETFENEKGEQFRLLGLMHGEDDYYYVMSGPNNGTQFLTCVSNIEGHGFKRAALRQKDK